MTHDPSDPETSLIAVSKGYAVIASASLSSDEWDNVRRFGSSLPAGRVTPSPKPFSKSGAPLRLLRDAEKSTEHRRFEAFVERLSVELIGRPISVVFANDSGWGFGGCYGKGELTVNIKTHDPGWFQGPPTSSSPAPRPDGNIPGDSPLSTKSPFYLRSDLHSASPDRPHRKPIYCAPVYN